MDLSLRNLFVFGWPLQAAAFSLCYPYLAAFTVLFCWRPASLTTATCVAFCG